jgi:SAM-dependent methyltransferase
MSDPIEQNRLAWDERARIHVRDETGFYDVEGFRAGGDKLGPIETAEIGDVSGLDIVHLQCHFGLDTLSLARRGARVTGLDFSGEAIAAARGLAEETGIEATFVEGNVYDAPKLIEGQFDMVYVTWGTVYWLPDIAGWCDVVGHFVKPGGLLYFADFHPFTATLEEIDGRLVATYDWRTPRDRPLNFDEETTYTGDATPREHRRDNEWIHPLSAIVSGLLANGLQIEQLNEHETLPWPFVPMAVEAGESQWRLPDGQPRIPLAVSIKARRPA